MRSPLMDVKQRSTTSSSLTSPTNDEFPAAAANLGPARQAHDAATVLATTTIHQRTEQEAVQLAANDDNKRILDRIEAAIADPTGRLRLLIDGTNATSIPGFELTCLRNTLRELTCAHSPLLRQLPMEIGHLYNTLRTLDCSHCALTSLPEEISLLHRLEVLNCSHNQLTTFVWRCEALKSLRNVNLSHNRLRYMSPTAAELLLSASSTVDVDLRENEASMRQTAADDDHTQRALLPVDVERCEVCNVQQVVLPPRVFVRFVRWQPRSSSSLEQQQSVRDQPNEAPRRALVPVLYPCCGPVCATALQHWQSNVSGRW